MTIVTYNVNSIRARLHRLIPWLQTQQPDVVALQEIKCQEKDFPLKEIQALGYEAAIYGQKAYNGVAILSRQPIHGVLRGIPDFVDDLQARLIAATVDNVRVICAYVPNGDVLKSDKYTYKLAWINRLISWLQEDGLTVPTVLCGDFNILYDDKDAANIERWENTVLYNDTTRQLFTQLLDCGFVDVFRKRHPEGGVYTWWDYRTLAFPRNDGVRIDHVLTTKDLAEKSQDVWVDRDERKGEKPSDHAPVWVRLS